MGILKDVLDLFKDIGNTSKDAGAIFRSKSMQSISKESSEGVLQFPVLVSKSLDMETSQLVSKALEKTYASFVQVTLSLNPVFQMEPGESIIDYLRKFHQNSDSKINFFDIKNSLTTISENVSVFYDEKNDVIMFSAVCEGDLVSLNKKNLLGLREPFADINMEILNNKVAQQKEYFINSSMVSEEFNQKYGVTEAGRRYSKPNRNDDQNTVRGVTGNDDLRYAQADYQRTISNAVSKMDSKELTKFVKNSKTTRHVEKQHRKVENIKDRTDIELPKDVLRWTEVQKLNEIVPTHMVVRVKVKMKDDPAQDVDFIIGIKSTLHAIESEDMVTNMVAACKNNSKIFNFIKWTTGEIAFFKDFLFNINEIKNDVMNRSSGASSWWITLKRRAALSKLKRMTFLPNNILPNATIVLSMEEVSYIKAQYGFDLTSANFVDSIMKTYFLLGFVIVDNSTQVVHLLFDGQENFQSYTFTGLQKETNSKDDFKQMLKLINRI